MDAARERSDHQQHALPWMLPASLDIGGAEPLQTALRGLLLDGAVRVDGSQVERISTPCLQVIAAAVTASRAMGREPALINPSPVMLGAIADLGLCGLLAEAS